MSLLRKPPARLRLAFLQSGIFLLLGTAVIVVILVVAKTGAPLQAFPAGQSVSRVVTATGQGGHTFTVVTPATQVVTQQHSADVGRLLAASWVVLALTALVSVPLGWFTSGRMLRPVREMTSRARTISARNLHERLAPTGSADEIKQLGDTLDDLLARLEASFEAQRRFVANASHELRTPLTVERTLLQVALSDPDASAAALRTTCAELLAAGRDQERLLDSMLTLASSEQGLETKEELDLSALARQAVDNPPAEVEANRIRIDVDLQAAPTVGDKVLIERLIANLVDNGVHHNLPGGNVEVRTGQVDGRSVVSVANSGVTVAAEEVGDLFEPFRRLDGPRIGAGTARHGLGLSIVRAIANAHGAAVEAEPLPEGGLRVTVAFIPGGGAGVPGDRATPADRAAYP